MVVIVSASLDPSTDKVIDWLAYRGVPVQRLDAEKIFSLHSDSSYSLSNDSIRIEINRGHPITSIWFRKNPDYDLTSTLPGQSVNPSWYNEIIENLTLEHRSCKLGFYRVLSEDATVLGNFKTFELNKLDILISARNAGLDIPATLITNRKAKLLAFLKEHHHVITKAFDTGLSLSKNECTNYVSFTEEITESLMETIPSQFQYSLFQEKLNKSLDIRTFFLDDQCFSMAIFSQLSPQTRIDFRKYHNNRNVPYQLPSKVENSIRNLMNKLELNSGSLDIVKTTDGRFVFLEVNPSGQYDMTSIPCNYHLDQKIADFLVKGITRERKVSN